MVLLLPLLQSIRVGIHQQALYDDYVERARILINCFGAMIGSADVPGSLPTTDGASNPDEWAEFVSAYPSLAHLVLDVLNDCLQAQLE